MVTLRVCNWQLIACLLVFIVIHCITLYSYNDELMTQIPKAQDIVINNNKDSNSKSNECRNVSLYNKSCICDYINLKGLEKSGTTWAIMTLRKIQQYFCNEKVKKEYKDMMPLCIYWHLNEYQRHGMILPHELIGDKGLMKHFVDNESFYNELNNTRFCTIVIFRDPRDRQVSWSHWNIRNKNLTGIALFEMVNMMTMRDFLLLMNRYNEYWRFYRNFELQEPMRFYNYFFEDMIFNPYQQIKDILKFIGFYNLNELNITDDDIETILQRSNGDVLMAKRASIHLRKGKICGFYEELTTQNAKRANNQTMQYLVPELIEKFNKTCPIIL